MKINLTSFLIGIIFCLVFVLFSGGILMPKHLKVNSIEIIDDGSNNKGYIVIKNALKKSEINACKKLIDKLKSIKNNNVAPPEKQRNGISKD